MDDHLSIAVGVELVASPLYLAAQFREVVDLSVEDHPDCPVFVVNGLLPAGQVNDAEPAHTQPHRTLRVDPFIIGPAVNDRLAHPVHVGGFDDFAPLPDDARYSTHWPISFSSCALPASW